MSDLKGAWREEEEKQVLPSWDFPSCAKASPEGPWNGLEDLFPEGKDQMPRSPKALLKAAQEHGWGFGPISLVMRLNRKDAKPLYASWLYNTTTSNWAFAGAGVKGHHIAKASEAMALVRTEPWKPDYERYSTSSDADYGTNLWCAEHGPVKGWEPEAPLPELLQAIEDHEKECHAGTD